MRARFLVAPVAISLLSLACPPNPTVVAKSSGSIGISGDDLLLFVADADHDRITVIDTQRRQVVGQTAVGSQPERVLVAPSGAVYVSNRGSRSVSRLSADGLHVEATATVGAEPVGLALSVDGKQLLVANSMSGTVSVLDPATLEVRDELTVGGQPWAIAPLANGQKAYVTDFTGGTVRIVDFTARSSSFTVQMSQPPEAECATGAMQRTPAQAADVILSPDGERAYVAHVQSRTGTTGFGGVPQSLALAVAPALTTIDTGSDRPFMEQRSDGVTSTPARQDFPSALLATNLDQACQTVSRGSNMDAPSSLVVDGLGNWIFVADHNSNAVAVVSATRRDDLSFRVPDRGIADVIRVGSRPTGIAVSADLRHAYVHNALDYSVSFIASSGGELSEEWVVHFAGSDLPPDVERGRRLFYSAVDPRVTQPELGGVSCSSCHPDGRTDALTWVLPTARPWDNLPAHRNTPTLWGVTRTAPYHWNGASADLSVFSTGMVGQMGGSGVDQRDVQDLTAYMATIAVPDNPKAGATAPGLLARGQQVFDLACAGCHSGELLTDRRSHPAASGDAVMLDTPSLRGVFATGPYLHDGSAPTLRSVITTRWPSITEHDQTRLSSADLEALEAFVNVQ